ncbi:hypothetical protein BT96DRAFT_1014812 [Gymnopus androsaceus JB14]|uniref:Integral membrane protein n=1 Tax=Gymnopus androsaceus JB14 TaxID=1447944 RepID=A0A6A4I3Z8_9AGAR|nr:hypothetical protein BT96DRAFT_1014812 [Gymnopus androsaceus JB14]
MSSTTNLVFCVTFFTIAQVSTVARVWIRYRKQRLWWDDGWAILTMMLSILLDILLFLGGSDPLLPISPHMQVVRQWLIMISFTMAVWCARISLMFSIIRLIPPSFTLRRISEWAAVSFSLVCILNATWDLRVRVLPYGELITDLVEDITLVVIPIRLLGHVNLPKDKRRMLVVIFGASLLTSTMSSYNYDRFIIPITAEVVVGTALAVANMGVLTPFLYRLIGKRDGDIDSKPYTHYPSVQTNGDIRMRRVSDLVASGIRLADADRASTSSTHSKA